MLIVLVQAQVHTLDSSVTPGTYLTFTVPFTGTYTIECWGAQGGDTQVAGGVGGKGGYTKGDIILNGSDVLYIYVGNKPSSSNAYSTSAYYYSTSSSNPPTLIYTGVVLFNGGGAATYRNIETACGGGSTDIRIIKHTANDGWSGSESLNSRIMVAGAGGGAQGYNYGGSSATAGGAGGGLNGYQGTAGKTLNGGGTYPTGGTQISGGIRDKSNTWPGHDGGFGYGGQGEQSYYGGGGGSGYWGGGGGGSASHVSAGGGGSSYISGHPGCVAIISASSTAASTAGTDNSVERSKHYSGIYFVNTLIIDGAGYKWTTAKGSAEAMPTPPGGSVSAGNIGNGFCRIVGTSSL